MDEVKVRFGKGSACACRRGAGAERAVEFASF
jgi:hypothetical protein